MTFAKDPGSVAIPETVKILLLGTVAIVKEPLNIEDAEPVGLFELNTF